MGPIPFTNASAATADFWQARPPQGQPHHRRVAAGAATFYFAKSWQDLGLGGLACRGGPECNAAKCFIN